MAVKSISTVFTAASLMSSLATAVVAAPSDCSNAIPLAAPKYAPSGASIEHQPSFLSFSFEPAFWVYFFGNNSDPNEFTFNALREIIAHGGRPNIRPGGETMDSMCFDKDVGNVVLTTSPDGGVYRTTVGPDFYKSWSNFPSGTRFTSTLNFGNNSLDIARDMAVASVTYQPDLIEYFELGNEPNNYGDASSRWDDTAEGYVKQWLNWTEQINEAVNQAAPNKFPKERWWASSATTDDTAIQIKPVDIIPAGVDVDHDVAQYSIHSYQFATCDPQRAALATPKSVLNHTLLVSYADEQILPSALAAQAAGNEWIVGEFNSIACSGKANTSNSFVQALWTVDSQMIYAARNASATYLHQGATLVFQSGDQTNSAGANGSPGFSTYDMLYPRDSSLRGPQRTLPGFLGVLFTAEALAIPGTRVWPISLDTSADAPPQPDYFSAYALYAGGRLDKLVVLNMYPRYANSTADEGAFTVNVGNHRGVTVKRMTTESTVLELDSTSVSWAGQTYESGKPSGKLQIEHVGRDGDVKLQASEAVLVQFHGW